MELCVHNEQSLCSLQVESIEPLVKAVLNNEQVEVDELHIHFVEEAQICELHNQFFQDPTPTDCISLQVDPPGSTPCYLGEIFISPQAALDYLQTYSSSLEEELSLYLVHGLLHLLGYDDLQEEEVKKMRLAEKRQMDYLKTHQLLIKL